MGGKSRFDCGDSGNSFCKSAGTNASSALRSKVIIPWSGNMKYYTGRVYWSAAELVCLKENKVNLTSSQTKSSLRVKHFVGLNDLGEALTGWSCVYTTMTAFLKGFTFTCQCFQSDMRIHIGENVDLSPYTYFKSPRSCWDSFIFVMLRDFQLKWNFE